MGSVDGHPPPRSRYGETGRRRYSCVSHQILTHSRLFA